MCQIWGKTNAMFHNVASLQEAVRLIVSTELIKWAGNKTEIHPIPRCPWLSLYLEHLQNHTLALFLLHNTHVPEPGLFCQRKREVVMSHSHKDTTYKWSMINRVLLKYVFSSNSLVSQPSFYRRAWHVPPSDMTQPFANSVLGCEQAPWALHIPWSFADTNPLPVPQTTPWFQIKWEFLSKACQ